MSDIIVDKESLRVVNRLMKNFIKKIGAKDEPLFWGIKANEDIQVCIGKYLSVSVDGKKVQAVKILPEPAPIVGDKTPLLNGLDKRTVVYIPNAENWNQDSLLRVVFQSSASGSKALVGFNDPSRLSLGIYQFLVSQQIDNDWNLSNWAINMSIPIGDINKQS
ncbi:hypothetical protein [Xenorhabdus sp. KJ12.1]|uniref:hypothetical protein n=1 Tax=Xenorhabdus sp. KJ12.1 TaxID=1851571 RepID=UPI000C04414E|nr:hypothetical protein [Xenorhabdus sp. KJ12.1]PHM72226.1 hypothetical protein Xekj_00504 [Xenorhabdus sp. KJ12.1]